MRKTLTFYDRSHLPAAMKLLSESLGDLEVCLEAALKEDSFDEFAKRLPGIQYIEQLDERLIAFNLIIRSYLTVGEWSAVRNLLRTEKNARRYVIGNVEVTTLVYHETTPAWIVLLRKLRERYEAEILRLLNNG